MPGAVILRRTSMFSTLFTRKPESTNTSTPLPARPDDLKGDSPEIFLGHGDRGPGPGGDSWANHG